jgi:hypothetical protein
LYLDRLGCWNLPGAQQVVGFGMSKIGVLLVEKELENIREYKVYNGKKKY